MEERDFRVEPLSGNYDRAEFSCGVAALDQYLREQASQDLRRGLSAVFVSLDVTSNTIAGFYTLSATQVDAKSLPTDVTKRLPRRPAPATLLGRFAVDLRYRGMGVGRALLADALARAANASREVGSMAVIVDAKDDAARSFYERFGFRRLVDDPYRLFLQMSAIESGLRKS